MPREEEEKVQYDDIQEFPVLEVPDKIDDITAPLQFNVGSMDQICTELPTIRPPPRAITTMFKGRGQHGKLFKKHALMINQKVSFASISMKTDSFESTKGVQSLRVNGTVRHNIGDIYPAEGAKSKFMQVLFTGGENNDKGTWNNATPPMLRLLSTLRMLIGRYNSFVWSLKSVLEFVVPDQMPIFKVVINVKAPSDAAPRTYNTPTCNEVAAIIVNEAPDDATAPSKRELILHGRNGGLRTVSSLNPSYDPLSYVLTHIHGDAGWTFGNYKSKLVNGVWVSDSSAGKISAMDFYSYRIHTRDQKDSDDIIQDSVTYGGQLFQQYAVDQWIKIEEERLNFMRASQDKLKAESYAGLADAVRGNERRDTGHYIVLASSHVGSPRHLRSNYQDAMAIVGKFGKPDYFITMTCNPKWEEITEHLREGEVASDRPDLISRVFLMKYHELLDDLLKKDVLGKVIG